MLLNIETSKLGMILLNILLSFPITLLNTDTEQLDKDFTEHFTEHFTELHHHVAEKHTLLNILLNISEKN